MLTRSLVYTPRELTDYPLEFKREKYAIESIDGELGCTDELIDGNRGIVPNNADYRGLLGCRSVEQCRLAGRLLRGLPFPAKGGLEIFSALNERGFVRFNEQIASTADGSPRSAW